MEADDLKEQLSLIVRSMVKDIEARLPKREAAAMKRKLAAALRTEADALAAG